MLRMTVLLCIQLKVVPRVIHPFDESKVKVKNDFSIVVAIILRMLLPLLIAGFANSYSTFSYREV